MLQKPLSITHSIINTVEKNLSVVFVLRRILNLNVYEIFLWASGIMRKVGVALK